MSPTEVPFWDAIDRIRELEPRYRREAYGFVIAALGVTVQALPRERLKDPERRHLSGSELLAGVVRLAHQEFGSLAEVVFREWGLASNEDVGAVVFHLVHSGQLSARPEDTLDDFRGGPDLLHALKAEPGRDPASRPLKPRPRSGAGGEWGA